MSFDRSAVPRSRSESRALANRERAERRARGRSRRYAKHNGLRYLWTLTYNDAHLPPGVDEMATDWDLFRRAMQRECGRFPWLRTFERGKRGTHRLHHHFGTSVDLPRELVESRWRRGFVAVSDHGQRAARFEAAASVAHYIAAYVGKEGLGSRGYDVARGFTPSSVTVDFANRERAVEVITNTWFDGTEHSYRWDSDSAKDWIGPEATFLGW